MTDRATPNVTLEAAVHRQIGVDLYNATWELLEKADRTADETDELIHRAHASRWHWARAGEAVNLGRGEWLCSRVYAILGRGEPALWHARRCVEIEEAAGIGDWDIAAAYEAMARAHLVAGDGDAAAEWKARATAALSDIAEADDRRGHRARPGRPGGLGRAPRDRGPGRQPRSDRIWTTNATP